LLQILLPVLLVTPFYEDASVVGCYAVTRNTPEHFNLQQYRCENLTWCYVLTIYLRIRRWLN
jgi:hypothetical protein